MGRSVVDVSRAAARPLDRLDPVLALVRDARVVLLGEGTHGTHEFYRLRAELTRRLVAERGFGAVCIEGDWPDAWRVNEWIHGRGDDGDAEEALRGFQRFPTWMWRNADVLDLVGWLNAFNDRRSARGRVSFYGLDLYSLQASMQAVIGWLATVDPAAAERARALYGCFDRYGGDPQAYGRAAGLWLEPSCEEEVLRQLVEVQARAARDRGDAPFSAARNAEVVRAAEAYYRTMFRGDVSSWNLRDLHMMETLEAVRAHLGGAGRVVVWAHNSHLGDARATSMGHAGELNLGQLCRERFGDEVFSLGFTTYTGTVTAAWDWDGPAERRAVREALPGSWEACFHATGRDRFVLPLGAAAPPELHAPRLERAIGVIYRPATERASHYFDAALADQFDAVIHVDVTRAVEPLERAAGPSPEPPETFPSAV